MAHYVKDGQGMTYQQLPGIDFFLSIEKRKIRYLGGSGVLWISIYPNAPKTAVGLKRGW
jgi:hypothetical protein